MTNNFLADNAIFGRGFQWLPMLDTVAGRTNITRLHEVKRRCSTNMEPQVLPSVDGEGDWLGCWGKLGVHYVRRFWHASESRASACC